MVSESKKAALFDAPQKLLHFVSIQKYHPGQCNPGPGEKAAMGAKNKPSHGFVHEQGTERPNLRLRMQKWVRKYCVFLRQPSSAAPHFAWVASQ